MYNSVSLYPTVDYGFKSVFDVVKFLLSPFTTLEVTALKNDFKAKKVKNAAKKVYNTKSTSKINSKYSSMCEIHAKDSTKWYKGEYDEFDSPVSALCFRDSILHPNCKSLVYYDEEITCAYIDYDSSSHEKIKSIELRQDGIISGIKKQGDKWLPYFINDGIVNKQYSKAEVNEFYIKVKEILKKAQNNVELTENNPINEMNSETDKIYSDIIYRM